MSSPELSVTAAAVTSQDDVVALVEAARAEPSRRLELVGLLDERAPVHVGRGANATARVRGWVLAAFEDVGLPDAAVAVAVEELETGLDPYLVAAAAKALRGVEWPDAEHARALLNALVIMRARDDRVTFDTIAPSWPAERSTTALLEVLESLRWMGAAAAPVHAELLAAREQHAPTWSTEVRRALGVAIEATRPGGGEHCGSCCGAVGAPALSGEFAPGTTASLEGVMLEDQDGERRAAFDLFRGLVTVVAFFYTRCDNPNKCSRTITQLGELQAQVATAGLEDGVRLVAVTYDPGYDVPARMRPYGEARGVRFGEHAQLLRAVVGQETLQDFFALRVGYNGSLVNRHSVELFLLDREGAIRERWSRVRWEAGAVLPRVRALVGG